VAGLYGLVQHSFALRMGRDQPPFQGRTHRELVANCFELGPENGARFRASPVGEPVGGERLARLASHSPLARHGLTAVQPLGMRFLDPPPDDEGYETPLPGAFAWAASQGEGSHAGNCDPYIEEARLVFGDAGDEREAPSANDFLLHEAECEGDDQAITQLLLEVVAQRRSRLFGLAMANRIVNAMLPHAVLEPSYAGKCAKPTAVGGWFLQPLVSFIRDDRNHRGFRDIFSLTLFLVPIAGPKLQRRKMSKCEIGWAVNAGWGLATVPSPDAIPRFKVSGPLPGYISRLGPLDLPGLVGPPVQPNAEDRPVKCGPQTLRQASEAIAYAVALRMARGSAAGLDPSAQRRVGSDVVTALGSARVSSLVFVDDELDEERVCKPPGKGPPPGRLADLMETLAPESRAPKPWSAAEHRQYRLDRSFVDEDSYVVGVLPKNRCLIVASAEYAQKGRRGSGLLHAGSVAYMTIGAATAIGTLRAIDHDLEEMTGENPGTIADIDGEIAADLHEIYDLDITREAYRHLYGLLRDRLGIAADYKTLQDKMSTLYRATSTRYGIQSNEKLERLTRRIVQLSVLIAIIGVLAGLAAIIFK
jgi:hypothetical protein